MILPHKLKVGKTFKPFTPTASSLDSQSQEIKKIEDEDSIDISFLNKIFANDARPLDLWTTPNTTKTNDSNVRQTTTYYSDGSIF